LGTQVGSERDSSEPLIRRKAVSARNDGGMMAVIDTGEYGVLVTDEPEARRHRRRPVAAPDRDRSPLWLRGRHVQPHRR
jgi:hypothetical protein